MESYQHLADHVSVRVPSTGTRRSRRPETADAKSIESALEETKQAMKDGGVERINSAREKLESASHRLAEAMYKATAGQQQAAGGPQADGGAGAQQQQQQQQQQKENVVDAEFVDVDEKNKK
jgi:molecular chaperone DnaK